MLFCGYLKNETINCYFFRLRPHVVWFGEAPPQYYRTLKLDTLADILVIIGTTLQVYPAAELVTKFMNRVPTKVQCRLWEFGKAN